MVDSFKSICTRLIYHDTNIWSYEGSLTMLYGIFRLPSRMTIIRLASSNDLAVISPFPPTELIKKLLAEIGTVKYIIVPNQHHTFWALQFLAAYPNAFLLATRGVSSSEKLHKSIHAYFTKDGLELNTHCPTETPIEWPSQEIDFFCFYSVDFLNEVIFYHQPSSSLIVTDLAFNYSELGEDPIRAEGYLLRFYLWLADGYRPACVTKPFRLFFRKKVDMVKNDFDEFMIKYQHFQRLVMAHGTIIHRGGYEALKCGTYQFVLDLYENEKIHRQRSTWPRNLILSTLTGCITLFVVSRFLTQRS